MRYMQEHRQRIGQYHVVGCLWAERISQLRRSVSESKYWVDLEKAGYKTGQKLVVVFDSWFHPDGMNVAEDLVRFADDIRIWLDERTDVFLVLKEKNHPYAMMKMFNRQSCERIYDSHRRLAAHPRVVVFGDVHDALELSSLANLVVSFPFTSITYESLCSGMKAVYYDPAEKMRGTYYDQFPGLILHGYHELRQGLNLLLVQTENEFVSRIAQAAPRSTELFLGDGAMTRFRELLSQSLA